MHSKVNINKVIKEQRKSIRLSLYQLSRLSGVSVAHLSRIENEHRQPSTRTLQKIAKHLGFDLYELLVMAGHLLPDPNIYSEKQREKLTTELNTLLDQTTSNHIRIKQIIKRLMLSK